MEENNQVEMNQEEQKTNALDVWSYHQGVLRQGAKTINTYKPEEAAEVRSLSQSHNVSREAIRADLNFYRQETAEKQVADILAEAPATRSWIFSNPEDASIIQQNTEQFVKVENALKSRGEMRYAAPKIDDNFGAVDDITKGFRSGYATAMVGGEYANKMEGMYFNEERANKYAKEMKDNGGDSFLWNASQIVGTLIGSINEGWRGAATGATIGAAVATTGIGAPAGMLIAGGAAIGAMVDSTYRIEAGLAFKELTDKSEDGIGLDESAARPIAAVVGSFNALIEAAGDYAIGKAFEPLKRELIGKFRKEALSDIVKNKTMASAYADVAKAYFGGIASETTTEVSQEFVTILGEEFGRAMAGKEKITPEEAANRLLETAVSVFKGMAVLGLFGAAGVYVTQVSKVNRAKRDQKFFKAIDEQVTEIKASQIAPDVTHEVIAQQAKAYGAENVYIDASTVYQVATSANLTDADIASVMPGETIETLQTKAVNGEDVVIKTADYASNISGTDLGKALLPHVRMSADALSVADAAIVEREYRQMIADVKNGVFDEAEVDRKIAGIRSEEMKKAYRDLQDKFEKQFEGTEFGKADARAQAKYGAWLVTNLAMRAGLPASRVADLAPTIVQNSGNGVSDSLNSLSIESMTDGQRKELERQRIENDRVNKAIQDYFDNNGGEEVSLGDVSDILSEFGLRGELVLRKPSDPDPKTGRSTPGVLVKLKGKHAREGAIVKNLYAAIQNPIAVFQSAQNRKRQKNTSKYSVVIVTELEVQESDGRIQNIIAPVLLEEQNNVTSVYSLDREEERISEWVEAGLLMGFDSTDGASYLYEKTKKMANPPASADLTDLRRAFLSHGNKVDFKPPEKGAKPSFEPIIYDRIYSVKDHFAQNRIIMNRQIEEVREQYEGTDKWMKAPNGKPTNLTEKQWLQVRTPAFKAWFGDWENYARISQNKNYILNGDPVIDVKGNAFPKSSVSLIDRVTDYFKNTLGGEAVNGEIGRVILDDKGVRSSIAHGVGQKKAAAFVAVKAVIERGKIINFSTNWKDRQYDTFVIAAPITLDGEKYLCEVVVTDNPQTGKRGFYLHEVNLVEVVEATLQDTYTGRQPPQPAVPDRSIVSRHWAELNGNTSKIVDENGEPLVVYHGTPNSFKSFEKGAYKKYGRFEEYGDFFYFSDSKRVGKSYSVSMEKGSGNVYECFLNIRTPKEYDAKNGSIKDVGLSIGDGKDGAIVRNVVDPAVSPELNGAVNTGVVTKAEAGLDEVDNISAKEFNALDEGKKSLYKLVSKDDQWEANDSGKYEYRGRSYSKSDKKPKGLEDAIKSGDDKKYRSYKGIDDRYDLINPDLWGAHTTFVATSPNQIKSATDNNGEFSAENDDIYFQKNGSNTAELDSFRKTISNLITEEEKEEAKGKTRKELQAKYGNKKYAIARVPDYFKSYLNIDGLDGNVYSSKWYMLDHAANHHPEVSVEKYLSLPDIIGDPDDIYESVDKRGTKVYIFIKDIGRFGRAFIQIENGDGGKLVVHRSYYLANKKPQESKTIKRLFSKTLADGQLAIIRTDESAHGGDLSVLNASVGDYTSELSEGGRKSNNYQGIEKENLFQRVVKSIPPKVKDALYQLAYHGSPYNFDKFTLDHIGEGEGNQAHGWGLYFSLSKKTAEGYRYHLTKDKNGTGGTYYDWLASHKFDGKTIADWDSSLVRQNEYGKSSIVEYFDQTQDFTETIKSVEQEIEEGSDITQADLDWFKETFKDAQAAPDELGKLYTADIPNDDVMLVEGKYFSDQPEKVKKAFLEIYKSMPESFNTDGLTVDDIHGTGKEKYNELVFEMRMRGAENPEKAASELLNKFGIKGIRYNGRSDGECAVVFDDNAITILDYFENNQNKVDEINGWFSRSQNTIGLTPNADLSTFSHEMGHWYLETIMKLSKEQGVSASVKSDAQTMLDHWGISDWDALDPDTRSQFHEQFAGWVETYLAEGKAPTTKTKQFFARLGAFIRDVYRLYRGGVAEGVQKRYREQFGVEMPPLSEDVRRVLDRMIASEDELNNATKAELLTPIFKEKPAKMRDDDWNEMQRIMLDAEAEGVDSLFRVSAKDEKWYASAESQKLKDIQAKAAEIRDNIKEQVTEEVNKRPGVLAMDYISGAKRIEGIESLKISEQSLRDMGISEERIGRLKRAGLVSANGMAVSAVRQTLAAVVNFRSDNGLLRALGGALGREKIIEDETTKRCLEKYSDVFDEKKRQRAVEDAIINEQRSKLIALELAYLADNRNKRSRIYIEAARKAAETMIAGKPVKQATVTHFLKAEAKASMQAAEAYAKGDYTGAIIAKRAQLVNHEAAMLAQEVRNDMDKMKKIRAKVFKADKDLRKTHDIDIINVARYVLTNNGLGKQAASESSPVDAQKYVDKLLKYNADRYEQFKSILDDNGYRGDINFEDLSVSDARRVLDTIQSLYRMARAEKTVQLGNRKLNKDEVVNDLTDQLESIGLPAYEPGQTSATTDKEKSKYSLMGLLAKWRRVEHWCYTMDGGRTDGPFSRYIYQPMAKAASAYRTTNASIQKRLADIIEPVSKDWTRPSEIEATEIGYVFTNKAELIGAILHTGNESNKHKLLLGGRGAGMAWASVREVNGQRFVDTSAWDAMFNRLIDEGVITKADMDAVQAIWDTLEDIKPISQKAYKLMFGSYFEEVEATPISTPFGEYRGGYVPAKTDAYLVAESGRQDVLKVMSKDDFTSQMPVKTPGFSKSRVPNYTKPLKLDIGLLTGHVSEVLRFAIIGPSAQEVGKIFADKNFQSSIDAHNPHWIGELLNPWLKRTYEQSVSTGGGEISAKLNKLRGLAGMNIMAGHIVNALQQMTGLTVALKHVSGKSLLKATAAFLENRRMIEDISNMSEFMASRFDNMAYEYQSRVQDVGRVDASVMQAKGLFNKAVAVDRLLDPLRNWAQTHAYFLQVGIQAPIDAIVWNAAYNEAISAKGMTDEDAVQFADSVVRTTQTDFSPENIATGEAGSAFERLFLVFYNYFGMQANLMADSWQLAKQQKKYGTFLADAVYVVWIPSVVSALAASLFSGFDTGDDDEFDEYDMLRMFIAEPLKNVIAMVPYGGSFINAAGSSLAKSRMPAAQFVWGSDPFGAKPLSSPSVELLMSSGRFFVDAYRVSEGKDVSARKQARDFLDLMTITTRLPFGALKKPVGYAAALASGEADPESSVDMIRGFVTGKVNDR